MTKQNNMGDFGGLQKQIQEQVYDLVMGEERER